MIVVYPRSVRVLWAVCQESVNSLGNCPIRIVPGLALSTRERYSQRKYFAHKVVNMKIEHVAYMVEDPQTVAAWYVENLGFTIKRAGDAPIFAHFLADDTGAVMVEIYNNSKCTVPEYNTQDPLLLHLALISDDIDADVARLTKAGAQIADEPMTTPAGDRLCMLRDPWGFALQLVNRA